MLDWPQQFWPAESAFMRSLKAAIPGDGRGARGTGSWQMKFGSIRSVANHHHLKSSLRSCDNYVDKRRKQVSKSFLIKPASTRDARTVRFTSAVHPCSTGR